MATELTWDNMVSLAPSLVGADLVDGRSLTNTCSRVKTAQCDESSLRFSFEWTATALENGRWQLKPEARSPLHIIAGKRVRFSLLDVDRISIYINGASSIVITMNRPRILDRAELLHPEAAVEPVRMTVQLKQALLCEPIQSLNLPRQIINALVDGDCYLIGDILVVGYWGLSSMKRIGCKGRYGVIRAIKGFGLDVDQQLTDADLVAIAKRRTELQID